MGKKAQDFYVVEAGKANIEEVDRLMKQQADHHGNDYTATKAQLAAAIEGKDKIMEAFLVYKPERPNKAVCCVMYRTNWTFEGKVSYLEEICTDMTYRGGGVGKFAVDEVERRTAAGGGKGIVGAVAKNNTLTMKFWLKNNYAPMPRKTYDLTNLFNDKSGALKTAKSYTAEQLKGPHAALPSALTSATSDPTTGVFVIKDSRGDPAALMLANGKFSSAACYRATVLEPVRFLKPMAEADKEAVMKTVLKAAHDFAKAKGYDEHLYAITDKDCAFTNDFMNKVGSGERYENSDPGSLLVPMGSKNLKPLQP